MKRAIGAYLISGRSISWIIGIVAVMLVAGCGATSSAREAAKVATSESMASEQNGAATSTIQAKLVGKWVRVPCGNDKYADSEAMVFRADGTGVHLFGEPASEIGFEYRVEPDRILFRWNETGMEWGDMYHYFKFLGNGRLVLSGTNRSALEDPASAIHSEYEKVE